jgi:hypothetical protein
MNDTAAPAAETSPTPPPAPLSAEARAFRFWFCRLPWLFVGIWLFGLLLSDKTYNSAAYLLALCTPVVGYGRFCYRCIRQNFSLSTQQLRRSAWTSWLKIVWLSWPQWLTCLVFLLFSLIISDKPLVPVAILTSVFAPIIFAYILFVTLFFAIIFLLGWEIDLAIRKKLKKSKSHDG